MKSSAIALLFVFVGVLNPRKSMLINFHIRCVSILERFLEEKSKLECS